MRLLAIVSIVTLLAATTSAQAPGAKPKPTAPPAGAKPAAPAAQARLLEVPGRLCLNGKPVPHNQKDWAPFVADLRKASAAMLKAAQAKNKELASDTTNDVAGACENCHSVYRDADPRCTPK